MIFHSSNKTWRKGIDTMKLFDSELEVMKILWNGGPKNAGDIARELEKNIGWNVNTTYTVIKKCVAKGAVRRSEPGFLCTPLIQKDEVQKEETKALIDRLFDGSRQFFLSGFLLSQKFSQKEIEELKKSIDKIEKKI